MTRLLSSLFSFTIVSPTSRPRQHHAQFPSSATSPGESRDQKRPYSTAQTTCTASRLEPAGHAAQVQSLTEPHITWPSIQLAPSQREHGTLSTPLSLVSCLSRLLSLVCRVSLVSCLSSSISALLLCSACPVLFVSFLCLSVSLAWRQRHSQAQAFVCFVGFPKAHFRIRLFEPWQRPLCAGRASPRWAVLRVRAGLPTSRRCSFPSTRSSNPPAVSHCRRNRALRLEFSTSQSHLNWTSNLGMTRLHYPRGPVPSTKYLGQVLLQPRQPSTCRLEKAPSQTPSLTHPFSGDGPQRKGPTHLNV